MAAHSIQHVKSKFEFMGSWITQTNQTLWLIETLLSMLYLVLYFCKIELQVVILRAFSNQIHWREIPVIVFMHISKNRLLLKGFCIGVIKRIFLSRLTKASVKLMLFFLVLAFVEFCSTTVRKCLFELWLPLPKQNIFSLAAKQDTWK